MQIQTHFFLSIHIAGMFHALGHHARNDLHFIFYLKIFCVIRL